MANSKTLGEMMPELHLQREAIRRDALEVDAAMKERIKALKTEKKQGQMSYAEYMEYVKRKTREIDAQLNKCAQSPNQLVIEV